MVDVTAVQAVVVHSPIRVYGYTVTWPVTAHSHSNCGPVNATHPTPQSRIPGSIYQRPTGVILLSLPVIGCQLAATEPVTNFTGQKPRCGTCETSIARGRFYHHLQHHLLLCRRRQSDFQRPPPEGNRPLLRPPSVSEEVAKQTLRGVVSTRTRSVPHA